MKRKCVNGLLCTARRTVLAQDCLRFLTAVVLWMIATPNADAVRPGSLSSAPEFHTVEVTVSDEDGHPLSGARVSPCLVMSKTGVQDWDDARWGPVPVQESDDDGKVRIRVPQSAGPQRISRIHWAVSHEDYVALVVKSDAAQRNLACRLKKGRRIAVSVIDGLTGRPLRSGLFAVLSGFGALDHWNHMQSGVLVSDGVAINRRILRIIHLQSDRPARFSAAIDLSKYDDQPRILVRNVEIHPGTRVEGQLDDQVSRPVRDGIVSAFVVNGRNEWHDMAGIREDGTFMIDSVPRGEILQLTASCTGWVSSDPTLAELETVGMKEQASRLQRSRVYPQVVRLDRDVVQPTIRMEPATTCRVTVLETSGAPVEGARVRLIPYQGSFEGRSHVFGHGESSRRRLLSGSVSLSIQRRIELGIERDRKSHYISLTGADGVTEVRSLPGGPAGSPAMTSFVVTHPDYFGASRGGLGDQGSSRAPLYSGQTARVTVRMKKK
ncbi:MAG: hypothetical protein MK110_16295 [Fuerstiella sp.]|nr:hypothetical protein [Fuerstiella sp.]